jgi:hypothetical protein
MEREMVVVGQKRETVAEGRRLESARLLFKSPLQPGVSLVLVPRERKGGQQLCICVGFSPFSGKMESPPPPPPAMGGAASRREKSGVLWSQREGPAACRRRKGLAF